MKFLHFFLLITFFCTSNSHAQNNSVDSLLQSVSHFKGEKKLDTLWEMLPPSASTTVEYRNLLSALEKESRKQDNDVYVAKTLYLKFVSHVLDAYYHVNSQQDSILLLADEANQAYEKANLSYGRSMVETAVMAYYVDRGEYELALYRTQMFLQDVKSDFEEATAYQMLGSLYFSLRQGKEARDMLLKAVDICENTPNYDLRFERCHVNSWMSLVDVYLHLDKDFIAALSAINKLASLNKNKESVIFWIMNVQRIQAYIELKQFGKAKELIDQNEDMVMNISPNMQAYFNSIKGEYYLYTGNLKKALHLTNEALDFYSIVEKHSLNRLQILKQKAHILDSLQNYRQSSELKNNIIYITDSISDTNVTRSLSQFQTIFQVERLKAEKEQHRLKLERTYLIGGTLVIICFFLAAIIIRERRNSKRLKEKNKKLFEQYKKTSFEDIKGYKPTDSTDELVGVLDKQGIYNKSVEYLLSSQQYLDPDLTRDALALEVGTNRQYLIEAIQDNAGMTYSEFIFQFRLDHACKLLLKDDVLTIEKIYQLSGFINRSTFYKHFNQKYGMSPAEFRRLAKEDTEAK